MTEYTKKKRKGYIIASIISLILTFGPLVGAYIYSWITCTTTQKVILSGTAIIALAIGLISVLLKYNFRSTLWIILIGIYLVMSNIITLLIIVGAATIIDELIVTPIKKHYKNSYTINKEIDKRNG